MSQDELAELQARICNTLAEAFEAILNEPLPERLRALLDEGPDRPPPAAPGQRPVQYMIASYVSRDVTKLRAG